MKRRTGLKFASIAILILGLANMVPHAAEAQQSDTALAKKIDSIFSVLTSPGSPGLAVIVRKNSHTVFERGYGVRDLRTRSKIDAQTNFRLASFTKQFTATAIMLLIKDGKLRYDQTLTKIFSDFPDYGKSITVRNLLNHTSGLPDYEDLMDTFEKSNGPTWSAEHQILDAEVFELLKKEKAGKFAPGASWSYSNSGYVVLGLIVAKASGQSFGEFLQNQIFAPLKMTHTIVFQKGKNELVNRAYGHSNENGALKETDQSSTSATLGDGGIYSNVEDLAKWDNALRNHALLNELEFLPALIPVKLNDGSQTYWPKEPGGDNLHPGKPASYGFGWFLDPYANHQRMWHDGSTLGFATTIQRFPGENLSIIILCNRTDIDAEKLAQNVAELYFSGNH
jgi:CubicO group peptidase (beta-lactamase class C family)